MATTQLIQHLRRVLLQDGGERTDGQLLKCFIEHRDEAAFAALVKRHGQLVWNVCRRLLGEHDAEDAFQATFLVLCRKATSIRRREMLASWLYGVAYQTALQARRTAARRRAREKQVVDMSEPTVVEQDRWNDLQPLLDQELSRLPDDYRVVLLLCDLESKTRKEVAHQLGLPEGTVASRLARARAMLAKRLARYGLAVSGGTLAAVLSEKASSASVPNSVMNSTVKAATSIAAGQVAITGAVSGHVAALTEGVIKAMMFNKLLKVSSLLLVLAMFGVGGSLYGPQIVGAHQGEPGKLSDRDVARAANEKRADPAGQPSRADPKPKTAKETLPKTLPEPPADELAAKNKAIHKKMLELQKKAADAAVAFEYAGAKRLDASGANAGVTYAGAIYQSLSTTTDDLAKVAKWYDRKLAGLIAGQPAGAEGVEGAGGEKDTTRRAVSQDGERPDLDAIAKRPLSVRSYLVRTKSYTISVVISRPRGEALTVISLSYMPE